MTKISVEMVCLLFIAQFINVAGLMFRRKLTVLFWSVESLQHLTLTGKKKKKLGSFFTAVVKQPSSWFLNVQLSVGAHTNGRELPDGQGRCR